MVAANGERRTTNGERRTPNGNFTTGTTTRPGVRLSARQSRSTELTPRSATKSSFAKASADASSSCSSSCRCSNESGTNSIRQRNVGSYCGYAYQTGRALRSRPIPGGRERFRPSCHHSSTRTRTSTIYKGTSVGRSGRRYPAAANDRNWE